VTKTVIGTGGGFVGIYNGGRAKLLSTDRTLGFFLFRQPGNDTIGVTERAGTTENW